MHDAPDVDDIVEEEVVSPWIEQIREYLESAQACAQASLDAAKRAEDAAKKAEEVGGNVSADMLEEVVDAYMQDHPPAEIVDNLTTNESTKALSAAQGMSLKSQIDEIANDVQSGENAIQGLSEDVESITKGAYFGTEKPNDPSVFLWVDPTDSGDATEGRYELIKTITLTAEQAGVTQIVETFGGKIYDGMIVSAVNEAPSWAVTAYCGFGEIGVKRAVGGDLFWAGTGTGARYICHNLNGVWDMYGYQGGLSDKSYALGQVSAQNVSLVGQEYAHIGYVRLYTFSAGGFPGGTEVKFYGKEVRKDAAAY